MPSGTFLPHRIGKATVVVQEELLRLATKVILQRHYENHIITLRQLYDFANKDIPGIRFMHCTNEEYNENEKKLSLCFDNSHTVSGAQRIHTTIPLSESQMLIKPYSLRVLKNIKCHYFLQMIYQSLMNFNQYLLPFIMMVLGGLHAFLPKTKIQIIIKFASFT